MPVWSGHHSKSSIWAAETRTQKYSSFTSDTFHCKRQIEKRKSGTGEKREKKIKWKLGLGWLENVNVLEISQHVKQTKQGNYVGIVSRWFYLSSCWKKGKQAFQELSVLSVSLFACAERSTWMSAKKVLLSSSVVTVVFLYIYSFIQEWVFVLSCHLFRARFILAWWWWKVWTGFRGQPRHNPAIHPPDNSTV